MTISKTFVALSIVGALLSPLAAGAAAPAAAQEATPAGCAPATSEESAALAEAYVLTLDEVDDAGLDRLFATDVAVRTASRGDFSGPAGYAEFRKDLHDAFPDIAHAVHEVVAEGDTAYVRWTATGTNAADWRGTPATGERRDWSGISRIAVECGHIVETVDHVDELAFLGIAPGESAAQSPAAGTPESCPDMAPDAVRAAVETLWAKGWNERDAEAYASVFGDDYVHRHHAGPDTVGLEAGKARVDALVAAAPDLEIAWGDIVVDGNLAAASWTISGTLDGELFGEEGAGAPFAYDGANVFRFACGEVVETWSEGDVLGAAAQIAAAG